MALGEVRHGILNKKKTGFYPVGHTRLVTTLVKEDDADAENKDKMKMIKMTKKSVVKIEKRVRNCEPKSRLFYLFFKMH